MSDNCLQQFTNSDKDEYIQALLPKNMIDYIRQHNAVNLQINFNHADADYGYGHMIYISVILSHLTRTCNRCGYDEIWNPDDSESKCLRHTYDKPHYDSVFIWNSYKNPWSLRAAFENWLNLQPPENCSEKPMVFKVYGKFGV